MGIRTSYSQNSCYTKCSRYWFNAYVEKWRSPVEGASLYFGSSADNAIMYMLSDKEFNPTSDKYANKFADRWETAINNNQPVKIFDNDNIVYSYSDFDADLLDDKAKVTLMKWAQELSVDTLGSTGTEIYREIVKIKKNPYKRLKDNELKYFNRASWLSLLYKGRILVNSFKDQFYPKIKRVIATQQRANIKDGASGDSIQGVIDMVLEIEGYDKPIIFDLKTAAQPYKQEEIDVTEQLTLYSAMKSAEYNTDLVGYVVLCKNIPKDVVATCNKCGYTRNGRHKTCDAMVPAGEGSSVRCNGSWTETKVPKPEVQVMVQQKTAQQVDDLLKDIGNIVLGMKSGVVFKNSDACSNWFGGPCIYKKICWQNDSTGLTRKTKED